MKLQTLIGALVAVFLIGCPKMAEPVSQPSAVTESTKEKKFTIEKSAEKPADELPEKPAAKPKPVSNKMPKGAECTLELAQKLNPDFSAAEIKRIKDLAKKIDGEYQGIRKELGVALMKDHGLPLWPLTHNQEPAFPVTTFTSVQYNAAPMAEVDWDSEHGHNTCVVIERYVTRTEWSVSFNGDPRALAGAVAWGLNREENDDSETYEYLMGMFLPQSGWFDDIEKNGRDIVLERIKKLAHNTKAIKRLGPWLTNVIDLLDKKGRKYLLARMQEVWPATFTDFRAFHHKARKDPNHVLEHPLKGVLYRRWLAAGKGQRANELMMIYRIWMARYAAEIPEVEGEMVMRWLDQGEQDAANLVLTDKGFYKKYVQNNYP